MGNLDVKLSERLALLRDSGQVDTEVIEFLKRAVPRLGARLSVPATEEYFGMLATHAAIALQRVRQGEPLREWEGAGREEVATDSEVMEAARIFVDEAQEVTGEEIPDQEVLFIAMHLGAARMKA